MTTDLTKKKRVRAGHKRSATRMINQVDESLGADLPDRDRLTLLRTTLNEKQEIIKALNAEIMELLEGEEELAEEIDQADAYQEELLTALMKADRFLKPPTTTGITYHTDATPVALGTSSPVKHMGTSRPVDSPPSETRSNRIKLPKLQLHPFGGELTKWTAFWESFESAIHNNSELSDVEKFNYLNSLLERSAREAVAGLALTSANYQRAIETLKKRFGCKQLIVNRHMDALLQTEAAVSSHNAKTLRKLVDHVNTHLHSLQSLGVTQDSYSSLLCPVLVSKLPPDLQLIVSRKASETDWELTSLMQAIEEEVSARERE